MIDNEQVLKNFLKECVAKQDLRIYWNYLFDDNIINEIINRSDDRAEDTDKILELGEAMMKVTDNFNALDVEDRIAIIKHYKEQGLEINLKELRGA